MRQALIRKTDQKLLCHIHCIGFFLVLILSISHATAEFIIDDFDYVDTPTAQSTWLNRATSSKVTMADSGTWGVERVMTLPCNYSQMMDRCYWDRNVTMDLSDYPMFALELYVEDPEAVGNFTLYFHSGNGWYSFSHDIKKSGWQTFEFVAQDFQTSGTPGGWDQVDIIRLSPWRQSESAIDTEFAARELRAFSPTIFIIRDDNGSNQTRVSKASADLSFMLSDYDVSLGVFPAESIDEGHLSDAKLAILPYNEVWTVPQITAIQAFVGAGGKLMVFFQLPFWLEDLLGFDNLGPDNGSYAAYTFDDPTISSLPDKVRHGGYEITQASPRPVLNARVIANWEDTDGLPTGDAAWLASDTGSFMSNYIRNDDRLGKQQMLLSILGHYVPEIWPGAASAAIDRIGTIAEYEDFNEAVNDIQTRGATTPRQTEIDDEIAAATSKRNQAISEQSSGQHEAAVWTAVEARTHIQKAYALSQTSAVPEFRSAWEHSGTGPYPGDWAAGVQPLADHGFTAVFPNSLKAGLAHYPSDLLPRSSQYNTYGDQIQQVVDAAHAKGLEVHVWKVNWNLNRAPQSFIDQMRFENRTQVSASGEPIDWLCPSHPLNQALEHDSMMEVLQNYDVQGLHFDYIRYPGPDACYDDGCRVRFQDETGNVINNWPADVRSGGPYEAEYLEWRKEQITELVESVYNSAKALKPEVKISAAVFGDYDIAIGNVGQDWVDWIDRGIVDHLHPMSTTRDHNEFRTWIAEQMAHSAGRVPIYPGIGIRNDRTQLSSDEAIVQLLATRDEGTGGFILFQLDKDLTLDTLPSLGLGTTLPGKVGAVPNGSDIPGSVLRLSPSGTGDLELSWGESCGSDLGATDYAIYQGTLAVDDSWVYDHQSIVCSTGGNTFETIPMPSNDHYYLVVPTDSNQEGHYGTDSVGVSRPSAALPCHPQTVLSCP